jgi:hypothetical protein
VWSWSLYNKEAPAHKAVLGHEKEYEINF